MSRHIVSPEKSRDVSHQIKMFALVAAGVVIIGLTAVAFWLSYAHLAGVAAQYGLGASAARQWAWPATLDLFIIAGELLMLVSALKGKHDLWAIGLTVAGSVGSIGLNVAGVGTGAPLLTYIVAAVPPSAALLAFGALMRQILAFVVPAVVPAGDEGTKPVPAEPVVPAPVLTGDKGTKPVPPAVSPAPEPVVPPVVSRQRVTVPAVSPARPAVRIRVDKTPEEIAAVSPVGDKSAAVPGDVLGNLTGVVRFLRETGHTVAEIKDIVPTLPGHEGVKADSLKKALARTR